MSGEKIRKNTLELFRQHLIMEEKSKSTIEKYVHDIREFLVFINGNKVTKERLIAYKEYLKQSHKPSSVNAAVASLNSFFSWMGRPDFRIKQLRIQQQAFCPENMELSKEEYKRLVKAAREIGDVRLEMIIQTLCGTGIRISELQFITVKAVRQGFAEVACKGKNRIVMLPDDLRKKLYLYMARRRIERGAVFKTKSGRPVDRSNIWRNMKALHRVAGVEENKIFPHNLRHLFARCFYSVEKDIAKLADVLGHSNVNTTRIYMVTTGKEHRKQLNALGLIL